MNENLDLIEILKDCPIGTKLYSTTVGGYVKFIGFDSNEKSKFPILTRTRQGTSYNFTEEGKVSAISDEAECILFPSKDQRDWSKFNCPKFDSRLLKPFDKVLVRNSEQTPWRCNIFSFLDEDRLGRLFVLLSSIYIVSHTTKIQNIL